MACKWVFMVNERRMGHLRGIWKDLLLKASRRHMVFTIKRPPIAKMNSIYALLPSTPNVGCPPQQFSNDDGPIEVLIINKSSITFG